MPLYATLPALTETVVERGWTRVYSRIDDVGVGWYLGYFVLYMASVEFFVYWMHRGLHDVRLGYRCVGSFSLTFRPSTPPGIIGGYSLCCLIGRRLQGLLVLAPDLLSGSLKKDGNTKPALLCRLLHHTHHKYNKEHTLSPFAGLAFNPLDGILQVQSTLPPIIAGPCLQSEALLLATCLRLLGMHKPWMLSQPLKPVYMCRLSHIAGH